MVSIYPQHENPFLILMLVVVLFQAEKLLAVEYTLADAETQLP